MENLVEIKEKDLKEKKKSRLSVIHAYVNNYVHFNQHLASSPLRTYSFHVENKPFVFPE